MIKDATKQIIKRTLQSSFDKEQFLNFTKNLLNHINEDKAFHAHGYVKEQFKKTANIIKTYERLGTYTDPNEKKIDILVVYLTKDNSIDRARTSLRNFVADYLKGRDQKDAALVAFVSPKKDVWRFSLVKMDYKFAESANGKVKVKEEFTPARRWSFLVGAKESSHTAQSRLAPILEDDESKPTLEQLEDAFNIEKVTKEFFEKYRELFLRLKDNLDEMVKNDAKIKADFTEKDVDTVDFAKKLLGQIVFLYFLQKKGWFGVERDADWGTGPKDFLRQLYNKKHSEYKNFFNEILEPMFYQALALPREQDDDYYDRFNCKIPFLNGGLFDPIGNYDWVHTDINLDNELFSNSRPTKQGDIGDGILDIFDRYNFTVREDEPLEKEVAVDPEMLGKVFENLLEVKDRKSKGTYYTPREIVHYMCQESLANYLATEMESKVGKEDIETLIKYGELVVEHDSRVVNEGHETRSYSFKIPQSIRKYAKEIDDKLASIRVCDPAVGSGAFPVGMMNEIIRTRNALTPYIGKDGDRTVYNFKRHAIQSCLYGVDIDPSAVEIAKLRLWLSLVVDEEERQTIQPLPNLDYKIVQGNSLSSVEQNLFNQPLFAKLEEFKPLYFNETSPSKKQEYKKKINELINQISNAHKDFDFKVYFSEIYHEKKGFDIIIANPPYGVNFTRNNNPDIFDLYDLILKGEVESYILFYYKSLLLLKPTGYLSFISPDSWFTNKGATFLRKYITCNNSIVDVFDWYKPFGGAKDTRVHTIVISKSKVKDDISVKQVFPSNPKIVYRKYIIPQQIIMDFGGNEWRFYITNQERKIFNKMENSSSTLGNLYNIKYGLRTGDNQKYIGAMTSSYPVLAGSDIASLYCMKWKEKYLKRIDGLPKSCFNDALVNKKIIVQYVRTNSLDVNARWIEAAYIEGNYIPLNSTSYIYEKTSNLSLQYLLGLLNSFLINKYYRSYYTDVNVKPTYLMQLPIPKIPEQNQKNIVEVVNKILHITKSDDYLSNPTNQAEVEEYEHQIDQMVYKLYDLTPEEIKIVEGKNEKI